MQTGVEDTNVAHELVPQLEHVRMESSLDFLVALSEPSERLPVKSSDHDDEVVRSPVERT